MFLNIYYTFYTRRIIYILFLKKSIYSLLQYLIDAVTNFK